MYWKKEMKRTNVVINEKLIKKAIQLTGAKSMREAIDIALRTLVDKESLYRSIMKLRGKLEWEGDVQEVKATN